MCRVDYVITLLKASSGSVLAFAADNTSASHTISAVCLFGHSYLTRDDLNIFISNEQDCHPERNPKRQAERTHLIHM